MEGVNDFRPRLVWAHWVSPFEHRHPVALGSLRSYCGSVRIVALQELIGKWCETVKNVSLYRQR